MNYAENYKSFVRTRIAHLRISAQQGDATSKSIISKLRRTKPEDAAGDPLIWEALRGIPAQYSGSGDVLSKAEFAAISALCTWARHHQKNAATITAGLSLGSAAAELARKIGGQGSPAPGPAKRIRSIATASSPSVRADHTRALVDQLASKSVPLDFGQLALDLLNLANPIYANGVRLRWGRELTTRPRNANNQE